MLLRLYAKVIGIFMILFGFFFFAAARSNLHTYILPDDSKEWVRVEGKLDEVIENKYRTTSDQGNMITEYEYIGNYKAQFRGKEVTLQRVVRRQQQLKETHVFYLEPSPYHDGFESMRAEVHPSAHYLPYLYLLMPLCGVCILVSTRRKGKK